MPLGALGSGNHTPSGSVGLRHISVPGHQNPARDAQVGYRHKPVPGVVCAFRASVGLLGFGRTVMFPAASCWESPSSRPGQLVGLVVPTGLVQFPRAVAGRPGETCASCPVASRSHS